MKLNFITGAVYIIVFVMYAVFMLGAGHGTTIFLAPLMPFGVGIVFIGFLFFLLAKLESKFVRVCFWLLVSVYYLNTALWLYLMWGDSYEGTVKMWRYDSASFSFAICWFVAGQAFILIRYFQKVRSAFGVPNHVKTAGL